MKNFYTAVEERRSIYDINDEPIISDEKLEEIANLAVKSTPTAFNSQTGRLIVLLGEQNKKFWSYVFDTLNVDLPEEKIISTENRINGFSSGHGTVLFFEDYSVLESFQQKFPSLEEQFTEWSHQASGILQYVVWTALEQEGYGASLQHFAPIVPAEVKKAWGVQEKWKLIAQLPFGNPTAGPRDKEVQPITDRVVIVK